MIESVLALATTIVSSFLTPYLKMGTDEFFNNLMSKGGESIARHALESTEKIWGQIKGLFSSEGEKVTLGYFQNKPEKFQEEMIEGLAKKLDENQILVNDLKKIIEAQTEDKNQNIQQFVEGAINIVVKGNTFKNVGNLNIIGRNQEG